MSSVSTDVLIRFDDNEYVYIMTGYYIPDEGTHHVIAGAMVANPTTSDNILIDVHWKPGQGVQRNTLAPMAGAFGPLGGYYLPTEGTQHVFVGTRTGDLFETYWKSGQAVQSDILPRPDLNASFWAGYYFPQEGTQHLIVSASDAYNERPGTVGLVTELYWKSGQGVNTDVLARFNGSVNVIGAYALPEDGTQHAIITAPDGNLIELHWKSGQGVQQTILIPHQNRLGAAFYSAHDSTQHAVLLSADGTLTDVYWQSGSNQKVSQNVLTQLLGVNFIAGYYSANDQMRHVIGLSNEKVLTEVYW